ncbi:hypothetical protein C6P40_000473 [Pichia californica]|uniref:RlpA-like protein double-psi beta-barrel domain-containing protein n=1 Tax=Pichia californica TaxID=460514 RepID=A0A9P6WPL4_9ASCO|nr:hypothetical protein C6P42_001865 [[Candida] californica]KAG0690975.1 hypothetical protein C6P40_000473 [[Candida] californica]
MLFLKSFILGLVFLKTTVAAPAPTVDLEYNTLATIGSLVVEVPTAAIISGPLVSATNGTITGTSPSSETSYNPATNAIISGIAFVENIKNDICGNTITSGLVAAVSKDFAISVEGVKAYSNLCGNSINVTYAGVTITVTVIDFCEDCVVEAISLGPEAFKALASENLGAIEVSWSLGA